MKATFSASALLAAAAPDAAEAAGCASSFLPKAASQSKANESAATRVFVREIVIMDFRQCTKE